MLRKLRAHLTFANVVSSLALFFALSTGTAYAVNTVRSSDIVDGQVMNPDLAANSVGTGKIINGTIRAEDLSAGAVTNTKIAANSIDSGKVADFSLTNQDVGVLFAEVSSTGTLDSSSGGGVIVTKLGGLGTYEVDFGRNITACTAVATIGPSGAGSAAGEVNVADRSGNAEAVFVDTNTSTGAAADEPFRLVVVC